MASTSILIGSKPSTPDRSWFYLWQDRHGGVIAMQAIGGHNVIGNQIMERFERHGCRTDLIGRHREADGHPFTSEACGLAIEGLVLTELLKKACCEKVGSGKAGVLKRSATPNYRAGTRDRPCARANSSGTAIWCRRAVAEASCGADRLSSTIRIFSASLKRRRRPVSTISSRSTRLLPARISIATVSYHTDRSSQRRLSTEACYLPN